MSLVWLASMEKNTHTGLSPDSSCLCMSGGSSRSLNVPVSSIAEGENLSSHSSISSYSAVSEPSCTRWYGFSLFLWQGY